MIYAQLFGRIGNNLFQIAATASLAKKHHQDWATVPLRKYHYFESSWYQRVPTYLQQFENNVLRNVPIRRHLPQKVNNYIYYAAPYLPITAIWPNMVLKGYFQSEKYFDIPLVRSLFQIDESTRGRLYNQYPYLKDEPFISVHVRRGDYLKMPSDNFILYTEKYFFNALEHFESNRKVLVLSDDLTWCRTVFKGKRFYFPDHSSPVDDLYLPSLCKDNIISNSSFCWWAAWLNPDQEKKVIAPEIWFGSTLINENHPDRVPDDWIKI